MGWEQNRTEGKDSKRKVSERLGTWRNRTERLGSEQKGLDHNILYLVPALHYFTFSSGITVLSIWCWYCSTLYLVPILQYFLFGAVRYYGAFYLVPTLHYFLFGAGIAILSSWCRYYCTFYLVPVLQYFLFSAGITVLSSWRWYYSTF